MKKIILIIVALLLCTVGCSQKKSVVELLEGTWQHVDDETNYLVFEDGMRKEIVDGMSDWDVEPYTLSDFCTNDMNKDMELPHEKDKYISCNESDFCWYIVQLDEENLILSLMGRGNTLEYKRVKNGDSQAVSISECEDFETFLNKYNSDFEFQKSRTIFPFVSETIEYEEVLNEEGEYVYDFQEVIITNTKSESEWQKIDFYWDPSIAERKTDAYTQEIEVLGDTAFIHTKGIENGIGIQAVFVCKNNNWYLQKTVDRSM
ncbi:MAG: hypothetical protein ACOXZ9_06170 [Bacteroidales bacterium]|jgi:hypothetical protein